MSEVVNSLIGKGFKPDPEMEPMLTILDFDMVKDIDLDHSAKRNKLRQLELITAAGFKGGEIFITLILV